ncbi:MAG: S41 family peptidase [Woeseiaceae bacterium]|nr:S41 family peptidase [Woeseiaceae bacterium]
MQDISFRSTLLVAASLMGSCGGGDSGFVDDGGNSGWVSGSYLPSAGFYAQCVAPRSGIDPATGSSYPDVSGTVTDENNFLRSYSNETYLWYSEIVDRDPALYTTPTYFDLLKTNATTASGNPKDKFHFTYPTDEWYQLSQGGISAGYGAEWVLLSATPPRQVVVAYTQPNSPATSPTVMLERGAEVLFVDGVDLVNDNTPAGVDILNAGLFPAGTGETHTFTIRDPGSATTRSITMTSANITQAPVQGVSVIATQTGNVGYLVFNDHIATAEQALIDAVNQLNSSGIVDLVIDLRYNGGGFLDIASEFAYMIAGAAATAGQTFELLQFNSKHPSTNPITGQPLAPIPFHTRTLGFSVPAGQSLPVLNLPRVFVLSGPNTCSASESIINSLRGVDVEVVQIGSTTCGKPYGFYATDNCGTTYFTIQFRGVNDKNFGDYSDGFSPANSVGAGGVPLPGCSVGDDFTHALGDPLEARFAAALNYRENPSCPAASGLAQPGVAKPALGLADGLMHKSPWRENRILPN